MTERPIIFTPENAQKCFDGVKTQTRRIVKPQPQESFSQGYTNNEPDPSKRHHYGWSWRKNPEYQYVQVGSPAMLAACPYGVVGDRLWVREAFTVANEDREDQSIIYRGDPMFNGMTVFDWRWTPSIHMPRWACRTVLMLTEVRVERLQDISEEDARKEGVQPCGHTSFHVDECTCSFKDLWESINDKGSWEKNPWVWVLCFQKVS